MVRARDVDIGVGVSVDGLSLVVYVIFCTLKVALCIALPVCIPKAWLMTLACWDLEPWS